MKELEIRKMLKEDIDALLVIENEAYSNGENWTKSDFLAELNNVHYYPFVSVFDNQIVGFCSGIIVEDEMQITSVTVKSEFRNKRIATKMLIYLLDIACKNNILSCILEVRENNIPAINLYTKFGFKKAGIRKKYYANKYDALVFSIENIKSLEFLTEYERLKANCA